MDEVAAGAVTAVWHDDTKQAKRWFEIIGEEDHSLVANGGGDDWDRRGRRCRSRQQGVPTHQRFRSL